MQADSQLWMALVFSNCSGGLDGSLGSSISSPELGPDRLRKPEKAESSFSSKEEEKVRRRDFYASPDEV